MRLYIKIMFFCVFVVVVCGASVYFAASNRQEAVRAVSAGEGAELWTTALPTTLYAADGTNISVVNINTAGLEELDTLPGIGPKIGQEIIDYREKNGEFARTIDIENVKGIGDAEFGKIKDLITVG